MEGNSVKMVFASLMTRGLLWKENKLLPTFDKVYAIKRKISLHFVE